MFSLLQLLPPYLIFITATLVIFPSLVTICLRLALHKHLVFLEKRVRRLINREDRGNQPEIISELERRFKEASSNLDQVNTAALIDQIYSQEQVWFLSCEQIDYLCRTLPNLLLAFGLLGTFVGITINLSSLSQTISQVDASNVSNLLQEIQRPLKGMGIAFTTSLTGLLFSAVLTVVNLIKNTSVAKYKLISAIEDYLDNIYLPRVQGNNRIDKAVDRLVFEFKDFLGRFGTTVRDAVESSLGAKIQEIVDVNKKANELAQQVYSGFQASSGTIASSANELKYAVSAFEDPVTTMLTAAQTFESSNFPQKLSEATGNLAIIQNNFSQSVLSLAHTTQTIEKAVSEIQLSSKNIANLGEEFSRLNQTSIQVMELHQTNQQSLKGIIPQLKEGAQSFISVVKLTDKLQQQIVEKADILGETQANLTKLVETLNNYTQQMNLEVKSFGDRFVESVSNQTKDNQIQLQALIETTQQCINHLNHSKYENQKIIQILENQLIKDHFKAAKPEKVVGKKSS